MLVLLLCLLFPLPVPFAPSRLPWSSCASLQASFAVHQPFVQYVGLCCVPSSRQPPRTTLSTSMSMHHLLLTCFVRESACNVRRRPRATAMPLAWKRARARATELGCICSDGVHLHSCGSRPPIASLSFPQPLVHFLSTWRGCTDRDTPYLRSREIGWLERLDGTRVPPPFETGSIGGVLRSTSFSTRIRTEPKGGRWMGRGGRLEQRNTHRYLRRCSRYIRAQDRDGKGRIIEILRPSAFPRVWKKKDDQRTDA